MKSDPNGCGSNRIGHGSSITTAVLEVGPPSFGGRSEEREAEIQRETKREDEEEEEDWGRRER